MATCLAPKFVFDSLQLCHVFNIPPFSILSMSLCHFYVLSWQAFLRVRQNVSLLLGLCCTFPGTDNFGIVIGL